MLTLNEICYIIDQNFDSFDENKLKEIFENAQNDDELIEDLDDLLNHTPCRGR